MGEVWKARDTRLDRSVAVKILPSELAGNAQLKIRFEREAKTISQLEHPHICRLYDVGDGYLVMELLEGESLADRLARGPLPLGDVFRYGAQIAEALGRAHRAGVVHRDLKPGNVMITKSGAKLLDFGLAKSETAVVAVDGATVQKPLTQEGTILGTFQYMAPEQLEGQEADARTDVFALGAILYEMATGARAFDGKTKTSLIAAIVKEQPRPISQVRPVTPPALDHVVSKCLEKDPDDRWQSAVDVAQELRWISESGSQQGVPALLPLRRRMRNAVALTLAALVVAVASITTWQLLTTRRRGPVLRLSVAVAPDTAIDRSDLPIHAIAPDGSSIVYAAVHRGVARLWLRHTNRFDAVPLAGTEGAQFPFFSPDGRWIGFAAGEVLKKVSTAGGTPSRICGGVSDFRGGTWAPDGTIYFVPGASDPVMRVSSSGGTPVAVSRFDPVRNENSHRFPQILPGGEHLLITTKTPTITSFDDGRICAVSLRDGSVRTVVDGGTYGRYLPSGHLLFGRGSTLFAAPFDAAKVSVTGPAVAVVEGVLVRPGTGAAEFDVSSNGTLVYLEKRATAGVRLKTLDRSGTTQEISTGGRHFDVPRFSPDGQHIVGRLLQANDDIGILDLARGTVTGLSFDPGNEFNPVWMPDGGRVIYSAEVPNGRGFRILWKAADGSGVSEELVRSSYFLSPGSVSPDGKFLAYSDVRDSSKSDLWLLSLADRKPVPLLQTPFDEFSPMFSPDGKWLAYQSNESGRDEIYVRSISGGGRWQISTTGGVGPRWSRDGREILYWNADEFWSVRVDSGPPRTFGKPVSTGVKLQGSQWEMGLARQYDVDAAGRFVVSELDESITVTHFNVIVGWLAEVEGKVRR